MSTTTKHLYLKKYPIHHNSEKLIIGTIHPHNSKDFILPFFYGNKLSLWKILAAAFSDELKNYQSLNEILLFLKKRKIAVSDVIKKCVRKNNSASDSDIINYTLNTELIKQIKKSRIHTIYFTSSFQKNSAFKLFYSDMLGLRVADEIKKRKTIVLDKIYFGRPIKLIILISPSGAANKGLARNANYQMNKHKYKHSKTPLHDFKVDYYKEIFSN